MTHPTIEKAARAFHAVKAEKLKIRDCLKAANAAKAEEMGL